MIQAEMTFFLPEIQKDVTPFLHKIGERMTRSVQRNFEIGGRPVWTPTKSGETPLVTSGRLYRSIGYRLEGDDTVVIAPMPEPKYARIHQEGGTVHPTVTMKSKAFFLAMWLQTRNTMWLGLLNNKKYPIGSKLNIRIPARPYLMFQKEDVDWIVDLLKNAVILEKKVS